MGASINPHPFVLSPRLRGGRLCRSIFTVNEVNDLAASPSTGSEPAPAKAGGERRLIDAPHSITALSMRFLKHFWLERRMEYAVHGSETYSVQRGGTEAPSKNR
jgi:hypothetical protein